MMYRKPLFWIALIVLVIISCVFIYRYGNRVFFFDLKITMNAKSSKAETIQLAKSLNLDLNGYKSSAAFLTDDNFQHYAELKCGGRKAFTQVLDSGIYHPIYWYVRLFKPGETREFSAYYSPTGKLLSFSEKVPETEAGTALSRSEAQTKAETEAMQKWKQDLSPYKLIEAKADTKPNGRIDHSFVYERTDTKLGEALYRLNLTVSGNRLTELYHFAKVPDKFLKEFEEMRSYNETLANVASGVMQLVYIVGLIIWFVILLRQKKLIFAPPLRWGIVIAIFMIMGSLNFFSFYWLDYDTSASAGGFMAEQIAQILLSALFMGALAWFTILVTEALTREAFPHQVQFWRLADKDVASSKDVLSKVLVGYLLFFVQLAYVVGFYGLMGSRFGWWAPSGVMSDPNILSTFMPFISAIGNALQPGFWEEALFRALPLATCAILGKKYNKRGLFLLIGMIIQVLVFSAAHANYPQQPFYFRLVELIVPSLLFAFAYIYFGLVTGVILHFTFDAVLMNLSALLSTAPGMNLDRILFFAFLLIPMWWVLIQKIRNTVSGNDAVPIWIALFSGWGEVPENKLNKAFSALPEPITEAETEPEPDDTDKNAAPAKENIAQERFKRIMLTVIIGFLMIIFAPFAITDPSHIRLTGNEYTSQMEYPRLEISATEAKDIATKELKRILAAQGLPFPSQHKAYADAQRSGQDEIYLVLKDPADHTAYSQLRNKYFFSDGWEIKFKRLKGSLDEKGESYSIFLTSKGDFVSYTHELPESRPGESVSEDSARTIVRQALLDQYKSRYPTLKEISVSPSKLPNRTDWIFTYEDSLKRGLKEGSPRMDITVRGKELAGIKSYVFIPEETQRLFDKQSQMAVVLRIIGTVLVIAFLIFAAVQCILAFSRNQLDKRVLLKVFLMLAVLYLARGITTWDYNEGQWFNPIQPYNNQLISFIVSFLVGFLFQNGFIAALAAMAFYRLQHHSAGKFSRNISGYGIILILLMKLLDSPRIIDFLRVPDWTYGLSEFGFMAVLHKTVTNFWLFFGLAILLFELYKKWTANYTRLKWLPVLLSFVIGYGLVFRISTFYWETQQLLTLAMFVLVSGLMVFAASYLYRRCKTHEALIAAVIIYAGSLLNTFFYPVYPWQGISYLVAYLLLLLLVWLIYRRTITRSEP